MVRFRDLPFVGKRSGVTLTTLPRPGQDDSRNLREGDYNAFFAAAVATTTKQQTNKKTSTESEGGNERPVRPMRFSIEGQKQNKFDDDKTPKIALSNNMINKIKNFAGNVTDADLSPVATASPLPEKKMSPSKIPVVHDEKEGQRDVQADNDEGVSEDGYVTLPMKSGAETPLQPATQEDEEELVGVQSTPHSQEMSGVDNGENFDPVHPEDGDAAVSDDDEVSHHVGPPDNDLIPPSPPDSPDDEGDIGIVNTPGSLPEQEKDSSQISSAQMENNDSTINAGEQSEPTPEQEQETETKARQKPEKSKKKKLKSAMKKKKKKGDEIRKRREVSDDGEESDQRSVVIKAPPAKKRKVSRKNATFSPKGIPLPREYESIPVSDLKETPPPGVRRSGRARCRPLEFWKNERAEYGPQDADETISSELDNMPVVKRFVRSKDTPYKPRKVPQVSREKTSTKSKSRGRGASSEASISERKEDEAFDSTKIRKKYVISESDEAVLWDDGVEETREQKVISYVDNMEARKLPLSKSRSKSEGKVVGKAAQAFNVPNGPKPVYVGYITGNLTLPPKGIKDAESVGSCSQVFTVVRCQPGAMEVAYSDPEDDNEEATFNPETAQRFLLKPGDLFRVPPGNSYRLCNHSKTVDCFLTWTIIRPASLGPPQSAEDSPSIATPR